ncbi:MAG: DEAD/DEAH box helicase [Actinobacteria bacterium]|nr:DEAD/DEAH box helicase [Actinomycetota bacterium]
MTQDAARFRARLTQAELELAALDASRNTLRREVEDLRARIANAGFRNGDLTATVTRASPAADKIALFRQLFRGREDVWARRWESRKSGHSGYQPACANEWTAGLCDKRRHRCAECVNRDLLPLTDEVIRGHLTGADPTTRRNPTSQPIEDFVVGFYPLLPDETCRLLAVDFDNSGWEDDVRTFLSVCRQRGVPAALERSRSGRGGHVWIFFATPVPASAARALGSFLLTETMEERPQVGLSSYDRLFPSQDTLPQGGFGSLIALPLQRRAGERGNSLFVDDDLIPHPDQLAFLSCLPRMQKPDVLHLVEQAAASGGALGVRAVPVDETDDQPWLVPPSRRPTERPLTGPLPERVNVVLANQIYIAKDGVPPALLNRFVRLAAFQNPEFFRAEAMRLPTFGKPRVIGCAEDFTQHIGVPRGCMGEVGELLDSLGIGLDVVDERNSGSPIEAAFRGALRPEQEAAARALGAHDTGVLAAGTAFGKTVVAAHLIAERGVNTLVLVHRQQLLDQWVARLSDFLNLDPKSIGRIGGGVRRPSGIIDVALLQSVGRSGATDDLVAGYGHLIVDECHHLPAVSFERIARQCRARYVLGLSATTSRRDGHHPIIFMQCGPIRYRVDDRNQAVRRPFEHRVVVRHTEFTLQSDSGDGSTGSRPSIQPLYAALAADDQRNTLIVEDVIAAVAGGRSPIVLTERREHLEHLAAALEGRVTHVVVMRGGMGVRQRRAIAARLAAIPISEARVLVATGRYLGEGFDDARLDTLFLALPISWRGTLAQYAGRLHRLNDAKTEVLIYDYADLQVPMLARMHEKRLRGYRAMGYSLGDKP